ncbi:MAG: tyrosine-type recombinase/integrase [Pseudomonadota bacterium]
MVKALRQLFRFAVRYDHQDFNPAADVKLLRSNSEGYHSWTLAEIGKFEEKHPVGTTAGLALALALYTGQRRSDLVQFGRQHVRDGWLIFTQYKGRKRHPVKLEIPIIPELQRIIDASPAGDLTFLQTDYGRPFSNNGFGNKVRKWCDDAGLPHCTIHGLRKAAAARLAELGCTEFEIMAITGHQTSKKVTRYTKAASQRTRAEAAFPKMTGRTEKG